MKPYPAIVRHLFLAAVAGSALAGEHAHHAHVHGQAKLEVAVDGAELDVHLESPLDALLGFERAPRNEREKAAVAALRQTLAAGEALFAPTAAAGCKLVSAGSAAPVLDCKGGGDGHGDLDADFRFTCAQPARLTGMEVRLFDVFPKLRKVDARVVSGKGQSARRLTAKMRYLTW